MTIRHLSFSITLECHYQCTHCDMWRLKDPLDALTANDHIDLLRDISQWNPPLHLNLSGGEPLRKFQHVLDVIGEASSLGHDVSLNTNGSLLTPSRAEQLLKAGLGTIVISLDSPHEIQQNKTRGYKHAFRSAVDAFLMFVELKNNYQFQLYSLSIIAEWSIANIGELVKLLSSLNVDGMLFQVLQPNFGNPYNATQVLQLLDDFQSIAPKQTILNGVHKLHKLQNQGYPVLITPEEFEFLPHYFNNPYILPEPICGAAEGTLVVDVSGNLQLCYNMSVFGHNDLGNIRFVDVREIWYAQNELRHRMKSCKLGCGMNQCNIRKEWD